MNHLYESWRAMLYVPVRFSFLPQYSTLIANFDYLQAAHGSMTPSLKTYYLISFVGRNAKMGGRGLMLSNGFCIHGKGAHDDSWSEKKLVI